MRAAINWVNGNCTHPTAAEDICRFLFEMDAAGVNCYFILGGGLVRSGQPMLVHWFAGELFAFTLTDAQASQRGVDRHGLCTGRTSYSVPLVPRAEDPAISLTRFELPGYTITQTTRIIGRLHYEVLANGGGPWCVRLDYELGKQHQHAWD